MKSIHIVLVLIFIGFSSCLPLFPVDGVFPIGDSDPDPIPVNSTADSVKFFSDIKYGYFEKNKLDFFKPSSDVPTPLVIMIHGGGFANGSKEEHYTSNPFLSENSVSIIDSLLDRNIAVANINYRLVEDDDSIGILKCLIDSKNALQFIRYHAEDFNVDKNKVVLLGYSAGAEISKWLAFRDDMASITLGNPIYETNAILDESTRVQGVVVLDSPAHFDFVEWHNDIFLEYQNHNPVLDYDFVISSLIDANQYFNPGSNFQPYSWYGAIDEEELLTSSSIQAYRDQTNTLKLLTADDPEGYYHNKFNFGFPENGLALAHHQLHVQAAMEKANNVNATGVFCAPDIGIDTRNGESVVEFIVRKIGS